MISSRLDILFREAEFSNAGKKGDRIMKKRVKIWTGLGAAALVSATALAGCSEDGNESAAENTSLNAGEQSVDSESAVLAGNQGEGEGEGEGEGSSAAISATDDIAYLTQLGLMRGHLLVGLELYRAGALDQARTHMKHPSSELYSGIADSFVARGAAGFSAELAQLSAAVEGNAGAEAVEEAYAAVLKAISESETHVSDDTGRSLAAELRVVVNLVRTAADEYAIGVKDGVIVNVHEYQDAYGFTQAAKQIILSLDAKGNAEKQQALAAIRNHLEGLAPVWPGVVPSETVDGDAAPLYGAAARIEILSLSLD